MNQQWKKLQPETATNNETEPHQTISNYIAHRIVFW